MQVVQQSTCVDDTKPHLHVLIMQMSVKAGIKKFGKIVNDALSKELRRLHDRKAMVPIWKEDMTTEDRQKALRYLMFIKEKRDGAVKARGCSYGRPQWDYTNKEDASSPTVSLEAMMMSWQNLSWQYTENTFGMTIKGSQCYVKLKRHYVGCFKWHCFLVIAVQYTYRLGLHNYRMIHA